MVQRVWMKKLNTNLIETYNSYIDNIRIVNKICFSGLIFVVIMLYLFNWRNFEAHLNDLVSLK